MSKIAGIKGHSPEAYPDTGLADGIHTASAINLPAVLVGGAAFVSLLAAEGPIETTADAGDRIIVMYSGVLENPLEGESLPSATTVHVAIFLNGSSVFEETVLVTPTTTPGNSPLPISIFTGIVVGATGGVSIDVRAETTVVGNTVDAINTSVVVLVSPN